MTLSTSFNIKNHLSETEGELSLTMLETSMFTAFASIHRWQEKFTEACDCSISGTDNTILNVIRFNERPKGLSDIASFLNRTDLSNIQYAIRKLVKLGLVQKSKGTTKNQRKDVTYEATEAGLKLTGKFSEIRRELIYKAISDAGFDQNTLQDMSQKINAMVGIYDNVARDMSVMKFD